MKKYDNYKDSGVEWFGEIPSHWNVQKLKINTKIKTGYTPLTSDEDNFSDEGTIWVKPDNLKLFEPIIDSKEKVSDLGVKHQNIIQKGSVLLCCIGTIGKFGVAGVDLLTNQQINSITFKDKLTNEYGKYLVFSFEDELNSLANGNVVRILNTTSLGNIKTPIPSQEEQTQIANYLDHKTNQIDNLISKKQQFITLLQEERIAVINQAVTKGLDPKVKMKDSGIEWLGEIPEHWGVTRLANFGEFLKGRGITKADLTEEGISVVLYGDIYTKYNIKTEKLVRKTSIENAKNAIQIFNGDLLFTASGETKEDIGKCIVFTGNEESVASGDVVIFRQNSNDSLFLGYVFNSYNVVNQKARLSKGEIVVHIYSSQLRNIHFALPSLEEQIEIRKHIDLKIEEILDIISKAQQEIELLKEYKTALISEVVTGKVDVRKIKLN
jgi:type I restriction enzyme S subunit